MGREKALTTSLLGGRLGFLVIAFGAGRFGGTTLHQPVSLLSLRGEPV